MSDSRLDKGLGKTSLALVWNKMKAYVNSFMGTVDSKISSISVDYIVEEGNDGTWAYRKWNSGLMEAWVVDNTTASITTSQTYGYLYYSSLYAAYTTGNASQFISVEDVRCSTLSGTGLLYASVVSVSVSEGRVTIKYWITNATNATFNVCVKKYIKGRWK